MSTSIAHPPTFPPPQLPSLIERGKAGAMPFPVLFDRLAELGVHHYTADLTDLTIVYYSAAGLQYKEEDTPAGVNNRVAPALDGAAVRIALQRRQKGESSYEGFCKEMAAAGVVGYEVDMESRKVTYKGLQAGQQHVESVPVMSP
jgi:uncharacterized protein YbcV (DUF1398 family)